MPLPRNQPRSFSARNVIILSYCVSYREMATIWHQKVQQICSSMNNVDNRIAFHCP